MGPTDDDPTASATSVTTRRLERTAKVARKGGVAGGASPPPRDTPPDPPSAPLPCGRFWLEAAVGRGAFGSVWRGRDRERGLPVAVKVVHAEVADTERASLLHEARAVAALDHPGIVRIVDLGAVTEAEAGASGGRIVAGAPWLAMDLARGGTLREEAGRIAWPRLESVLVQLLDALAHAHAAGMVHRDLKPANVLREGGRVLVTDFGIAALGGARQEDLVRGTPAYMAPEQIAGDWRALGPWTDLYSLGCLAWALATGRPPHVGTPDAVMHAQLRDPLPAFQPAQPVPDGFEDWLRLLLRKRPGERPAFAADAARLLAALHRVRDAGPAPLVAPRLPASWHRPDSAGTGPSDVADGERLLSLRTLPMVGRVPERDTLWSHLRRVVERDATVVAVFRGPAGIGKTRLSGWLSQRTHELGVARVVEISVGSDFLSAAGAAVARSAAADGLSATEAEARVAASFGRRLAHPDLSALSELCAPGTGAASESLSQPAWRHALLGRWLRALSVERPVIVRIEDAHRDPEALAFAQSLLQPREGRVRIAEERGVMALVTVKDDALGFATPAWQAPLAALAQAGAEIFTLGPLGEEEQRAHLRAASGAVARTGVVLAPALAAAVLRHADGNPLYIEQIVRGWASSGALVQTSEGLQSRTGAVPPLDGDLSAAWTRRVEHLVSFLREDERAAVEIAATLGARFDTGRWQEACANAGVVDRMRGLDVLVEQRLVARPYGAPPGTFAFMHGGLREALLAGAGARGRAARWHLACARAFPGDTGGAVRARALHLAAADAHAEALDALADAATEAMRQGSEEVARELATLRRQVLERGGFPAEHPAYGEQLVLEGENAILAEDWALVDDRSGRAVALGEAHGWGASVARAMLQRARWHRHHGHGEETASTAQAAVAALRRLGAACPVRWLADALRVEGDALGAPWRPYRGTPEDQTRLALAAASLAEARALYVGLGDEVGAARCDLGSVTLHRTRGDVEGAARLLPGARDAMRRAGNARHEATCLIDLGDILRVKGDLDAAEACFREAGELCLAMGLRSPLVDTNLGLLAVERQRHAEGIAILEPLRAQLAAIGRRPMLIYILSGLAHARYALGEAEAGREAFTALAELLHQLPTTNDQTAYNLRACARLAFACGDGDVALRAAELSRAVDDTRA